MICKRLLFNIAIIALFVASAYAEAGDPLNPGQLGESMSMPLSQDLLQAARESGVITESNLLYETDSKKPSFSSNPQRDADYVNSIDNVNVTGSWSFDLEGALSEKMMLHLFQNENAVMGRDMITGRGVISRQNETYNATVRGSLSRDALGLIVMPEGVLDLYSLNLSLSTLSKGTYTAYMADGSSRSGDLTFSVSSNIFKPASLDGKEGSGAIAGADTGKDVSADKSTDAITNGYAAASPDASTPVQIGGQGQGGRISSSKTISMASSGGSMSTSSSYG